MGGRTRWNKESPPARAFRIEILISIVSWVVYKQSLDLPALLGLGLIIAEVLVINLFSKSVSH